LLIINRAKNLLLYIPQDFQEPTSDKISSDITKTYIRQHYQKKYPALLNELKERLNKVCSRKDDWDGLGSKKPELITFSRAHILLDYLLKGVIDSGYIWRAPLITSDENGHVTIEWHKGKHELHIEVSKDGEEYIKIWGANIEHEMHVDVLNKSNYLTLWKWLIDG